MGAKKRGMGKAGYQNFEKGLGSAFYITEFCTEFCELRTQHDFFVRVCCNLEICTSVVDPVPVRLFLSVDFTGVFDLD